MKIKFLMPAMLAVLLGWGSASGSEDTSWVDAIGPDGQRSRITIIAYDPVTKTFEVSVQGYEGQGPLITTPEFLVAASEALKAIKSALENQPEKLKGTIYYLDKNLTVLMPEAVEARSPRP